MFSHEELANAAAPWIESELGAIDIHELRDAITAYYVDRGYVNSGVVIPDQQVAVGVVVLRAIEGGLTVGAPIRFVWDPADLAPDARLMLAVFDVRGLLVRRFEADPTPGTHEVRWNGTDEHGATVASGVYVTRFVCGGESVTRRMTMLK